MLFAIVLTAFLNLAQSSHVEFALKNESQETIVLVIPGVMDPVLAPKTKSFLRLPVGQEVFFVSGDSEEKMLLFTVDEEHLHQTIKVYDLIKEKEKELRKKQG